VSDESVNRWAHYSDEKLEQFLREVEQQDGNALPGLLADIRMEIERRRRARERED
jgi:hypothetical protein